MFRPARIVAFAAIALASFGTAAGIAAIGRSDDLTTHRYAELVYAPPAATASARDAARVCDVTLLGGADRSAIDLSVASGEIMDMDLTGSQGVSVACGAVTADAR